MKYYEFTPAEIAAAENEAEQIGPLGNSITRGEGMVSGLLGQLMDNKHTGSKPMSRGVTNYELDNTHPVLKTIEVKTTRTTVVPKPWYNCHVACINDTQECDTYVFCRVLKSHKGGWWLGWISKEEFLKVRRLIKEGELDDGKPLPADCWNCYIHDLHDWPITTAASLNQYARKYEAIRQLEQQQDLL